MALDGKVTSMDKFVQEFEEAVTFHRENNLFRAVYDKKIMEVSYWEI